MAGIYYRFRVVGAEKYKAGSKKFLRELESAATALVKETGELMINQDMASAIETWQHRSAIHFKTRLRLNAKSITVSISTDDEIFNYIEGGTRIRHAVMDRNFVPKTTPGSLRSARGNGRMVYVNESISLPGVDARNFYELSAKKQRAAFIAKMRQIYIRNLIKFGLRKM